MKVTKLALFVSFLCTPFTHSCPDPKTKTEYKANTACLRCVFSLYTFHPQLPLPQNQVQKLIQLVFIVSFLCTPFTHSMKVTQLVFIVSFLCTPFTHSMKVTQLALIVSLFVHLSLTIASTPLPTQSTKVRYLSLLCHHSHTHLCVSLRGSRRDQEEGGGAGPCS